MNSVLTEIVAVAVVLGLIVFIHELGHFLAAKFFNVRVETFSLGFGARLIGFRRGETDYRISVLPLGGYVRMAGENPMSGSTGDPREFMSKPRWQRLLIAFAGPLMNILLAIGLMVPIFMRRFPRNSYLDQPAVVAAVRPGSPAAKAGVLAGDRIVRAGGQANPNWQQLGMAASLSVNRPLPLQVRRGGRILHLTLVPVAVGASDQLSIGLVPRQPITVESVNPGSPAAQAGIRPGDRILGINGQSALALDSISQAIRQARTRPVRLKLRRGRQILHLAVTPRLMLPPGGKTRRYMIGMMYSYGEEHYIHLPFGEALRQAVLINRQYAVLILDLMKKLVSGQASPAALAGPIGIASITGQAARQPTLYPLVGVTSMISLNLGILNLLPVPVLDGGLILFLLIESLLRRDVSLQVKERVYQAGFAFLVLLMTFVVYNDIARAVSHHHLH